MRAFQGENPRSHHLLIIWLVLCLLAFTFTSSADTAAAAAPLPPGAVTAQASNEQITLTWTKVGEAASFRVYRSYVSGRDYEPVAEVAAGSGMDYIFCDTALINGVAHYYVITTLDGAGSESVYSSEVTELPAPQVASASLISPTAYPRYGNAPLLIAANFRFENYIVPHEPAPWLRSQVRLGSASQPPSAWTQITPAYISGLSGDGQPLMAASAVYPGGLTLEDHLFYVVCFSTNAGRTWTFFGPRGRLSDPTQVQPEANLGLISLIPQSSIDAPSQPGQPVLVMNGPESIAFSWTPSTDQDTLLGYDIYRAGPDDDQPHPVARVLHPVTHFQDTGLRPYTPYTYTVRAVDSAFRESLPSASSIFSTTNAAPVTVNILASVPPVSPGDIFINRVVDANHLAAGANWKAERMTCDRLTLVCSATLLLQEGSIYSFSISRGSAETLQTLPDGNTPAPESAFVVRGLSGKMTFHTIVFQWDDPLVVGYSPSGSATDWGQRITVVWNQAMPLAISFKVEQKLGDQFSPVPGSVCAGADRRTFFFDPEASLADSATYRVQVQDQFDVYARYQQIPFTWEFTTRPIRLLFPLIFH